MKRKVIASISIVLLFVALLPASVSADTPGPRLIATYSTTSGLSVLTGAQVFAPTGIVVCLVHEPFITFDTSLPFPARITSTAVVGCDTVFTPGTTQVVEFNAGNTPKFQQFVTDFTNATDENFSMFSGVVNAELMPDGPGLSGGTCETIFGKNKTAKTCNPKNLLTGYTIDFIRLTVSNIQLTVSADRNSLEYSVDVRWQFYGHR